MKMEPDLGLPAMAPIVYKMYLVCPYFGKSVVPSGECRLPEDAIPQKKGDWETTISRQWSYVL